MKTIADYPKELVEKREVIEGSFIFCLWKNADSFGDYEKDIVADRDFITDDAKFYYTLGLNMYKKGYKSFDDASIHTYLMDNEVLMNGFTRRGGYEPVNEMKAILNVENIEGYYDELVKNNAILQLHDEGYDVLRYIKEFDKMNYAQLEDFLEYKLNNIFLKSTSSGITTVDLTTNYTSWIDKWDSGEGIGYRVGFPMLNYHLAGIHKKNLILHLGGIGQGKAQPMDAKIMTPNGYMLMKDIKVGTDIYGEDGKIHKVVGVFPQGKKSIYEVKFNDNTSTRTCDEHIWTVQTAKMRTKGKYKNLTLKEIMNEGIYKVNSHGNRVNQHFIPVTKPLEMKERELKISPYYFGILLGEGNFTNKGIRITINSNETDVIEDCRNYFESVGFKFNLVTDNGRAGSTYGISKKDGEYKNKLKQYLIELGLDGLRSEDKFIPNTYLYNSIENRLELLKGLIDSDGEVNQSNYTFSTSSRKMSEQVQWLVQSLGGTARIENRQTYFNEVSGSKKVGLPSYRLHIKMPNNLQAFKSEKHKNKFKIGQREAFRCITEVNYIGEEECQCIMTNNPTHLYLTDNMIVTHNTTSSMLMYVLPIIESGEKICIIANEQDEEQFRQMILASVLFNRINYRKMNRQKLLIGGFSQSDKDHLIKAAQWLEKYKDKLFYVHLTDYGTSNIKRIIKKYSKLGVGAFLVDTLKPLDEASDKAWAEFSETAKMLFQISQKEDVAVIATAQLSSESSKRKYLDLSCIGKSRAIAETAGQVIMFRPMREQEKKSLEVYSYVRDLDGNNTKTKQIIKLDDDKDYIIVFIPKNRYGQADIQIVYERNQSFNYLKELGYCHVEYDGFGK